MLNIFQSNAFSVVNLTEQINQIPFQPGRIGELGIFAETRTNRTLIAIEEQAGILVLVPPTPRGGPGVTLPKPARTMRAIGVPHFEINDAVMADEVQGVRAFGSETEVETLVGYLADRDVIHTSSMAVTQEYSRLGALTGVITYADGSTIDLFSFFGVVQEPEIDFDLDNATPVMGTLRQKCSDVYRLTAKNMGGVPFTGIHCFCGDNFYNLLIRHPEIRETMTGWSAAANLLSLAPWLPQVPSQAKTNGAFIAFDIVWENYRGQVGATTFINTDKAYFFPTGAGNFAKSIYAPADYNETVNTMGQRLYQKQRMMQNDKGWHLDTQMNALELVIRPKALIKGRTT